MKRLVVILLAGTMSRKILSNEALPLIETQILYAGYRLATLLNSIF